jgi:beta-glucanase (GH16 family)
MQRRFLNLLMFVLVVNAVLVPIASSVAAPQWKLVWQDQFNGPVGSRPNPASWGYDVGNNNGWGNRELEIYTNSAANAHIVADPKASDGKALAITVIKDKRGHYTSARINTLGKHSWKYGRFEMRAKLPAGLGLWSAGWLVGANITDKGVIWPDSGAIDVFQLNEVNAMHAYGTAYGPGFPSAYSGFMKTVHLPHGQTFDNSYHVFTMEWTPTEIKWYADKYLYNTLKQGQLTPKMKWVFDHPFSFVINLAVSDVALRNPTLSSRFPKPLLIDYVRVYQHD